MKIVCQQQDIFKIKKGIKGHGLQEVVRLHNFPKHQRSLQLECGCDIPISYLPTREKEMFYKEEKRIPVYIPKNT